MVLGTPEEADTGIFYIDGHLPEECCERGLQIGQIHSHPVSNPASYREFDQGYSEDDIRGLAKEVLNGYYKRYPIVVCVIVPIKETEHGLLLDIQCEKYEEFTVDDIKKIRKNAENDIMEVPPDYPWNEFFDDTDIKHILVGYPVSVHPTDAIKKMANNTITKAELFATMRDQLFFNTDYASLKKGLKEQGKLSYDHFIIGCKKIERGTRDKSRVHFACDAKEENIFA